MMHAEEGEGRGGEGEGEGEGGAGGAGSAESGGAAAAAVNAKALQLLALLGGMGAAREPEPEPEPALAPGGSWYCGTYYPGLKKGETPNIPMAGDSDYDSDEQADDEHRQRSVTFIGPDGSHEGKTAAWCESNGYPLVDGEPDTYKWCPSSRMTRAGRK